MTMKQHHFQNNTPLSALDIGPPTRSHVPSRQNMTVCAVSFMMLGGLLYRAVAGAVDEDEVTSLPEQYTPIMTGVQASHPWLKLILPIHDCVCCVTHDAEWLTVQGCGWGC